MDSKTLMDMTSALRQAGDLDGGVRAALEVLLDAAARSLPGAAVLRGMAHLRPGGIYKDLIVLERSGQTTPDLLPSASAWQVMTADPRPMVIDVMSARARTPGGDLDLGAQRLFSLRTSQTIARLRSRLSTLLLALPLRGPDSGLLGALSIELNTDEAELNDGAIDDATHWLQGLVDVLAIAIPGLPAREAPALSDDPLMPVVGEKMRRVLRLLSVFAQQDETLLLSGATGVGKSQLASWCHGRSQVRSGPIEAVVLSTLPEAMQLPSLFGWKRGAFTGAVRDSPGAVTRAEGGTLFIDEIDKLSPRAQAGLLQLLESRQYRPVGDPGRLKTADVRFVIGTNVDLAQAVEEGRFLEDLFFRINVLPVQIPTLSERIDEIPGWVEFMAGRRHERSGLGGRLVIAPEASALLAAQKWPGNLRQLNNSVRRAYAVALADGGAAGGSMQLLRRHVEQAMAMDLVRPRADSAQAGAWHAMEAACSAILEEAERRAPDEREQLFLLADAFSALLLHQARLSTGDLKSAYTLMGRSGLVASRSHRKDFRRRMKRLQELCEVLGLPIDEPLAESMNL